MQSRERGVTFLGWIRVTHAPLSCVNVVQRMSLVTVTGGGEMGVKEESGTVKSVAVSLGVGLP
jgi:hypothetical protein